MTFQSLWEGIENKSVRLAIIGLGYVGLPVAARFAQVGFEVTGLDVDADKVTMMLMWPSTRGTWPNGYAVVMR